MGKSSFLNVTFASSPGTLSVAKPELTVVVAAEREYTSRLAQGHRVVVPARQLLYHVRACPVPGLLLQAGMDKQSDGGIEFYKGVNRG